ncbi:MAG: FecR domain-containing protein [Patescibacteria group bacterium]|nr:FecR domain-containing protein [Patescibacteria group bacterium]
MLGGVNNFQARRSVKPRVHAGADDYFQRRPETPARSLRNPGINKRQYSTRQLHGSSWMVYLYWFLGGLAAIAVIFFIGRFLRTSGVSAKLVFQEGGVMVKRGPNGDWKNMNTDAKLRKLDEIKTEGGGRAIISFDDGSIIRLGEFSRIILSGDKNKITVIQTDGTSYHRVIKSEKHEYEVDFSGIEGVPETKILSMGTAFWVNKKGTELMVGVLENKVKYTRDGDELEVEEGQKLTIAEGVKEKQEIEAGDLKDDFIAWNLEQDEKKELAISSFVRLKLSQEEEAREQEPQEEEAPQEQDQNQSQEIALTGTASDKGVTLNWELKGGLEAPDGFKIVKGSNENPEYPGSYYRSVRSDSTRTYIWDVTDGQKHNFRVCVYDGSSGCKLYSNNLEVEANKVESSESRDNCKNSGGEWDAGAEKCSCPSEKELKEGKCVSTAQAKKDCEDSGGTWSPDSSKCSCPEGESLDDGRCTKDDYATSVSLSGSNKDKKTANLSWTISGGKATKGYKIVRSKSSKNPSYPGDDTKSISNGDTKSYKWDGLTKGETYYFRVCVWDGSKCVTYSNSDRVIVEK